jgi:hypothetical protein
MILDFGLSSKDECMEITAKISLTENPIPADTTVEFYESTYSCIHPRAIEKK